jgi:hypothetical protein
MTAKLFIALYVGLIAGMIILFITNFPVAWVFFAFVFVTIFGGIMLMNRPYLIAVFFLLASLIVLGIGLSAVPQARQVSTWPTGPGVITRSRFCTYVFYSGPCLEYRYRANGQTFEGRSQDTEELAQSWRIPDIYQEGREVKVYYDPNNPGISRLTADISPRDWITSIIGAIMAALSTFTLFWVLWKRQATPQPTALANLLDERAIHPHRQAKPHRNSPTPTIPDIADQLEKLANLRQQQAITNEEYELAKKRLLGSP